MRTRTNPTIGEGLLLKREPDNIRHQSAVAVIRDGEVVGHVPYNLAPTVSQFLRRDCNKAFVEVTGDRVNRGAGYGVEVPCVYRFLWTRALHQEGQGSSSFSGNQRTVV